MTIYVLMCRDVPLKNYSLTPPNYTFLYRRIIIFFWGGAQ